MKTLLTEKIYTKSVKPARGYPESNRRGFAPILVIIAVLVVAVIGITFWYLQYNAHQRELQTFKWDDTPRQISSLAPQDPTANWKTYTDPNLNISFQYPANWKVNKDDTGYLRYDLLPPNRANSDLSITVFNNKNNLSLAGFDKQLDASVFIKDKLTKNNREVLTSQNITAFYNTEPIKIPGGFDNYERYIIPYKGKIVVVQSLINTSNSDQKKAFDHILPTFKFTN